MLKYFISVCEDTNRGLRFQFVKTQISICEDTNRGLEDTNRKLVAYADIGKGVISCKIKEKFDKLSGIKAKERLVCYF